MAGPPSRTVLIYVPGLPLTVHKLAQQEALGHAAAALAREGSPAVVWDYGDLNALDLFCDPLLHMAAVETESGLSGPYLQRRRWYHRYRQACRRQDEGLLRRLTQEGPWRRIALLVHDTADARRAQDLLEALALRKTHGRAALSVFGPARGQVESPLPLGPLLAEPLPTCSRLMAQTSGARAGAQANGYSEDRAGRPSNGHLNGELRGHITVNAGKLPLRRCHGPAGNGAFNDAGGLCFHAPLPRGRQALATDAARLAAGQGPPFAARVRVGAEEGTLRRARGAGLEAVALYVPSGSQRLLDRVYAAGIGISQVEATVAAIRRAGLACVLQVLPPGDADDAHSIAETQRLLVRTRPDAVDWADGLTAGGIKGSHWRRYARYYGFNEAQIPRLAVNPALAAVHGGDGMAQAAMAGGRIVSFRLAQQRKLLWQHAEEHGICVNCPPEALLLARACGWYGEERAFAVRLQAALLRLDLATLTAVARQAHASYVPRGQPAARPAAVGAPRP